MRCDKCGLDMYIDASEIKPEGDNSPDNPTKVYTVQSLSCHNPQCVDKGKAYDIKIQIYPA